MYENKLMEENTVIKMKLILIFALTLMISRGNNIGKQKEENKTKKIRFKKVQKSVSDKTSRVAVIEQPNGFFHLHQGHFTDDRLNKMIMHLTTFLAFDFDLTTPNGLV